MRREAWVARYPGDHPVIESLSLAHEYLNAASSQLETTTLDAQSSDEFHSVLDDTFLHLNDLDVYLDRQAGSPGPIEDRQRPRPCQKPVRLFQPPVVVRDLCYCVAHVIGACIRTKTRARMTLPQIEQARMLAKEIREDATELRGRVPSTEGPLSREARIATGLSPLAKERADNVDAYYLAGYGERMPDEMRAAVIHAITKRGESAEIRATDLVYEIISAFDGPLRTMVSRKAMAVNELLYHWRKDLGQWLIVRVTHVIEPNKDESQPYWICSFEIESKGQVVKATAPKKKRAGQSEVSP